VIWPGFFEDNSRGQNYCSVIRIGGTDYDGTTTTQFICIIFRLYTTILDDRLGGTLLVPWTVLTVNAMEVGVKE